MIKKFFSHIFTLIVYGFIRLLIATCKINHINESNRKLAMTAHPKGSYILSGWHEHVIMIIISQRHIKFRPIISKSSSGRLVGYICKKVGWDPVYGSADRGGKDKGGTAALFALLRGLKKGQPVAITVDGSVGPRRVVKPGIIDMSRKTGAFILPIGIVSNHYWELNTWDKLKVPKPFSTWNVYYGDPIQIKEETKGDMISAAQSEVAIAINLAETKATELP